MRNVFIIKNSENNGYELKKLTVQNDTSRRAIMAYVRAYYPDAEYICLRYKQAKEKMEELNEDDGL